MLESVQRSVGSVARSVTSALTPRFRPGDLDNRDPDFMREVLPATWLFVSAWFRPDIRGLHHIPGDGPVLVVGNHTGGASSPEVHISQLAISTYFGVERAHYQLAHRMVLNSPVGALLRRFGTVEADPDNAAKALDVGAIVTVFPGGDHEVYRPSWESARIDMGGRKGFLKLALEKDVPIVPMVTLGGQETALFLSRGEGLARFLGLDKSLRLKSLPIMLSLPFGLQVGPLPHIPLPSKVTIRLLEPIHLRERYGEDPDIDEIYADLLDSMQETLTALQRDRRLPVIG
ncbi:MAG: lysophospholipid acyltransferase family protein [Aeromicrobium sp.]